jgi:hypothetical protein
MRGGRGWALNKHFFARTEGARAIRGYWRVSLLSLLLTKLENTLVFG